MSRIAVSSAPLSVYVGIVAAPSTRLSSPRTVPLDDVIPRYLKQTRPIAAIPEAEAVRDAYALFLDDIFGRLSLPTALRPRLYFASTPDAHTETVFLRDEAVIVEDVQLAQCLADLSRFSLESWPADHVMAWAFRILAVALIRFGRVGEATVALDMAERWVSSAPPSVPATWSGARHFALQQYFVLAHECAHTALADGDPEIVAREGFREVVDSILAALDQQLTNGSAELKSSLADEITKADADAMGRAARTVSPDARALPFDAASLDKTAFGFANAVGRKEHLYEELRCDVIATELTMDFARHALRADRETALSSIFLTMSNLVALDRVRYHARCIAQAPHLGQTREIALRRGFWRMHALLFYAKHAGGQDALDASLTLVSNQHLKYVLDILNDAVPLEFIEGLIKVPQARLDAMATDNLARAQITARVSASCTAGGTTRSI
jgi:hypothetical protein